jgi:hypothetical protein
MFYPFHRFRLHFRRLIFGDKFWVNKKVSKTKFPKEFGAMKGKCPGGESEKAANQESAKSAIADYVSQIQREELEIRMVADNRRTLIVAAGLLGEVIKDEDEDEVKFDVPDADKEAKKKREKQEPKTISMSPKAPLVELKFVSASVMHRMKHDLGYKLARDLILDSGLPYAEGQRFVEFPEELDEDVTFYDNKVDRDFKYNVGTGATSWVTPYNAEYDDELVRERATKINVPDNQKGKI